MKNSNSRALELTIISGESLSHAGKRPIKKNTYVVVKTESNNSDQSQLATVMDTENGSNPSWNHKLFIDIPMHLKFFTLQARCRNFSGDHAVGSARVPISDFTGRYFPGDYLHFLSYRLRDRYGERNGIINLSVKVKTSPDYGISGTGSSSMVCVSPATGWKHGGGATMGQGISQGMVIGVPVQNRY